MIDDQSENHGKQYSETNHHDSNDTEEVMLESKVVFQKRSYGFCANSLTPSERTMGLLISPYWDVSKPYRLQDTGLAQ